VLEGVDVEVSLELSVEDREDVLVELGSDALRVVVGGLEDGRVLDQVRAEQKAIVRSSRLAIRRRKPARWCGTKLPTVPRAGRSPWGLPLTRSRSNSKSQTRPRTLMPSYSAAMRSAVSRVISSEMSTGQ
jgi:hypothetical protein